MQLQRRQFQTPKARKPQGLPQWVVLAVVAIGLALSGCAEASEATSTTNEPSKLVEVDGQENPQVVITDLAAKRLGIEMEAITEEDGTLVAPYASVVYDSEGKTWVYTSPKRLAFERTSITVDHITGDKAFLSAGPKTGTEVVTVATAELFGVENEIGH